MTITARYAGRCGECGGRVQAGEQIEWSKSAGARHVKCVAAEAEAAKVAPGPIALRGGSGYDCTGWSVGQVILSGEKRRREGGPDGLVIVTASRRYVREDGLSCGVGDDSGYLYQATARPATAEEMAPAIEAAHVRALADERALEIGRLRSLFAEGQRLTEEDAGAVASEQGADRVTLNEGVHGSGREWIAFADAEHVVLVHGGHYDDYRVSASRLPRTPELEQRVRSLA